MSMIAITNYVFRCFIILKATASATYKEWAAYRSHMVVSLFVGPVFFLVQVCIWTAVYSSRTTLNGLTLQQMLTYYGIAAVINYLTIDFSDWNLQMLIQTGKFLTFMLRPVSHCYFSFCQKVGHRMLSFWMEFIPILLFFSLVFKINLIPKYPFWALLSISLSFILAFLTNYCIGTLAFWLTKTGGLRRAFLIFKDISSGIFIPLILFPEWIQKILFFLPFQFIAYVPIRVFIGSYELAGLKTSIPAIIGMQLLAVIFMFFVYKILWHFGIKRFTGVGT